MTMRLEIDDYENNSLKEELEDLLRKVEEDEYV